jgi:hypothetical protein
VALSELLRDWLFGALTGEVKAVNATLRRIETKMASGEQELQGSIARVGAQIGQAVAELKRLADKIEANPGVDLTEEVAELNALADRLDAAVPDAAPEEPPVAPAPGA